MLKFLIVLAVVIAVVVGGLLAFRRSKGPLPPQDVLDRVKQRERELEARERLERK